MSRTIGINISFLRDDRNKLIRCTAEQLGFEPRFFNGVPEAKDIADCEVLFGMFPPHLLKEAKSLRWMQCSFAGVDRYTGDHLFADDSVILTNAAGAYGITISEHMICTLLMMMRRMPEYAALTAKRGWEILGNIRSIYGSRITVIGMGDIGSCFGSRCAALGAVVSGVRRRTQGETFGWCERIWPTEQLCEAVSDADVVALCVPGTGETRHMIGVREFGAMKDGAYFLNVGRGTTVDQKALYDALESGKLSGAAIDVTEPEPLPPDHFLWNAPNLLLTPHISGNMSLEKTCELVMEIFIENLKRYAEDRPLTHVVDIGAGY